MHETIKILIVEDNPSDAELSEREIKKSLKSCRFLRVETPDDFLSALTTFQPDIIVSDFMMPRFDGLDVLNMAGEHAPLTPVIILTGSRDEETAAECIKTGAIDYVIKEHIPRLGRAILHALEQKKLRIERRNTEKALKESEERFRRLTENAQDIIFRYEFLPERGFAYISPAATTITGYPPEKYYADRNFAFKIIHPDDKPLLENSFKAGAVSTEPLVTRWIHSSGSILWIEQRNVPVYDDKGRLVALEGIARDVTERKTLEEQLIQSRKMESVGRLAGGVAHDFNNMLQVVLGYCEISMEQVDSGSQLFNDLQEIKSSAERSANLTRQLLAFARKQAVAPRVLDINEIIPGMKNMLNRFIGENIELKWRLGKDLWKIRMDPAQIDQILANLVINARDAIFSGTGEGVGTITIETGNITADEPFCEARPGFVVGEYVLLTVSDTGTGMDAKTIQNIFEPFFTTKEKGKGTGLGLATVYGIVKQNNGFIYVCSEPGMGASFRIYLPRFQGEINETHPEAIQEKQVSGVETVLVVEDEKNILIIEKNILKKHGYNVLTARTPAEAITLAEKHGREIHLLVTDVIMPGMNGRELKEKLETMIPNLKTIFISGYSTDVIARQGILNEGVNFLQKPFTVAALAEKVREVIDEGAT